MIPLSIKKDKIRPGQWVMFEFPRSSYLQNKIGPYKVIVSVKDQKITNYILMDQAGDQGLYEPTKCKISIKKGGEIVEKTLGWNFIITAKNNHEAVCYFKSNEKIFKFLQKKSVEILREAATEHPNQYVFDPDDHDQMIKGYEAKNQLEKSQALSFHNVFEKVSSLSLFGAPKKIQ